MSSMHGVEIMPSGKTTGTPCFVHSLPSLRRSKSVLTGTPRLSAILAARSSENGTGGHSPKRPQPTWVSIILVVEDHQEYPSQYQGCFRLDLVRVILVLP